MGRRWWGSPSGPPGAGVGVGTAVARQGSARWPPHITTPRSKRGPSYTTSVDSTHRCHVVMTGRASNLLLSVSVGIPLRDCLPASYIMCDTGRMADTITFRPDEDAARALAVLTRDGTPVSSAVRAALIDAARERARSALRAEAEALAADEQDRAEAAQVLRDMESLRAW